jgi:hypothetical protein
MWLQKTESEDLAAYYQKIRIYHTVHSTAGDPNNETDFTIKFLNNHCQSGMMSHLLKLKVAVCIIAYESGSQKEYWLKDFTQILLMCKWLAVRKVNAFYTSFNNLESSEHSLPFTMRRQPTAGASGLAEDK